MSNEFEFGGAVRRILNVCEGCSDGCCCRAGRRELVQSINDLVLHGEDVILAGLRQDKSIAVSGVSADCIDTADGTSQQVSNRAQQIVTGIKALGLIDHAKILKVKHDDGELFFKTLGAGNLVGDGHMEI